MAVLRALIVYAWARCSGAPKKFTGSDMRLALLFSGQGGQRPEHWQQVAAGADGELRQALLRCLPDMADPDFCPEPEMLVRNAVAQPLIFGQQMLLWSGLQARLPRPVCVAGYSLGEMAACCVAGIFSPAQGVGLAAERAQLMDNAAGGPSGMLAVLGLDEAVVEKLAAAHGLSIAIYNAPQHVVLAGPQAGLLPAAEALAAAGASRLVHLAVRTPSHTPRLSEATTGFRRCLADLPDRRLSIPVLSAIDATPARTSAAALDALARQISSPLNWQACLEVVREMQPDVVLEIGPGDALSKLFAEVAPNIPVRPVDAFRSVDGISAWLGRFI
jgi:[acyl-carrier-protein] S-malonyltransferase